MKSFSIRAAGPADIGRMMEIRLAVRENRMDDTDAVTLEDVARFIDRHGMWVAEVDGKMAGFSAGNRDDGSIWALFMDIEYENRGIATALLERACETVRQAGHTAAELKTGAGTRAARFYERRGWQQIGVAPDGQLMFRRDLSA